MKNAYTKYLERHKVDASPLPLTSRCPDLLVVIPCYDEPGIKDTLEVLLGAQAKGVVVEIIVVVNNGEHAPDFVKRQNEATYQSLQQWALEWPVGMTLSPLILRDVPRKYAGAGWARKVGMDLAVARLVQFEKQDGIIISLDADTLVAHNYFQSLYDAFANGHNLYGAIIRFEHLLSGTNYPPSVYEAITHYELHLRYVNQAMKMVGFPYAHHTVGSAFAVRASAYVKHGGMNRKQGGEDFYFLHKLFPHGRFIELNDTCVYPSPRPSHRVPFGTGPQVNSYMQQGELATYDFSSFLLLRGFFALVPSLFDQELPKDIPDVLKAFLEQNSFSESLKEIRRNTANRESFIKRFFLYFDAFKLVKFLNYAHQTFYKKQDVLKAAQQLLVYAKLDSNGDASALLQTYRKYRGEIEVLR